MPDSHHAVKSSLSFAKLVATPTELTWSQAYNAGNLFACLSLTVTESTEDNLLPSIGKEVLNILEAEYFGLAEKSVHSIKDAISTSLEKVPDNVTVDLTLANFKDTTLSVFIVGSGKVVMKRNEQIGVILEKKESEDRTIHSASGYLMGSDIIVLQTGQFAKGTSDTTVAEALELALPTDIVESLSPQMHEQDNGAQSAIVITYHSGSANPSPIQDPFAEQPKEKEEEKENNDNEKESEQKKEDIDLEEPTIESLYEADSGFEDEPEKPRKSLRELLPFPLPAFASKLTHRRKLYLSIAIILLVLLCASIFLTIKKQSDEKQAALFKDIYSSAQQYYEEGQGLESLNTELSQESYTKAENKIKEGDGKISPNSTEGKQLQELLAKIQKEKVDQPSSETASAKETEAPKNSLLAIEKDSSDGRGFGQDGTSVFIVTDKVITSIAKSNGAMKDAAINDTAWTSPIAVVPYQGNIYVLDTKNGVIKFVNGSKSSYFTGSKPDLSKASGMAIDGSIWIVTKDSKVLKYTRGQADSFSLTGLDTPLKNPTKIVTNIDIDNVYILDNGNSRVIQTDKKGAFKKAYSTSVIAQAKDFDVNEKDKKILILSGGKVWELPL